MDTAGFSCQFSVPISKGTMPDWTLLARSTPPIDHDAERKQPTGLSPGPANAGTLLGRQA